MRQTRTQVTVRPRPGESARDRDQHDRHAGSDERDERAGARAGQRPAHAEEGPAHDVADAVAERFRRRRDRPARRVAKLEALDRLERYGRDDDGRADDAVHVKRLEPEHLLNPEPGDRFRLEEHDAEQCADEEVARHSSLGNSKYVVARPPAKNPQTATSDASWRSARPAIAWPEVQPPAYAVPKPTRNPPTTIETNPRTVV